MSDLNGKIDLLKAALSFIPGRAALLLLPILMTAGSAAAQPPNILGNPDFDVDLSSWTSEGGTAVWSPEDADGAPDSGSAQLDASLSFSSLYQCVDVGGGEPYQARVNIRYLSPVQDDELRLRIFWHDAEKCTIHSIVGLDRRGLIPQNTNWRELALQNLVAPPTAVSAWVDVVALPSSGLGLLHVDDFRLIPGTIFSDGFESGDTSAWSGAIGTRHGAVSESG